MKTQIYGTFGPACASEEILIQMIECGLTGMRLNLSHSSLRDSKSYVEAYQCACEKCGVKPQILIDMQGPELRIGRLDKPLNLQEDEQVLLGGRNAAIPVPEVVMPAMEAGDEVLLDDGKIALQIIGNDGTHAEAVVKRGGILCSHKSIKITGKQVSLPVLTEHDVSNLRLAAEYGVTGLMQPFVRSGQDLVQVRKSLVENHAGHVKILAKIENREAVANLQSIMKEADVIIIARGDLGNDMELWELPAVQKDIEQACKQAGKPFVVVTQMLASMEEHPVPTRAEVSDIFNAVADGAYGVMITGESAVGKYPVEAVKYLANTARSAEAWLERSK